MHQKKTITVAIADDHLLFVNGLAALVQQFADCKVVITATAGKELITKIKKGPIPDVLLLDINMPDIDGYEACTALIKDYPELNVLMLTMYDEDINLLRSLKTGAKGLLKKNIHPSDLHHAIISVTESPYYYCQTVGSKLVNMFYKDDDNRKLNSALFSDNEIKYLKMSCTEMSYNEIDRVLHLSTRASARLRDNLFFKLEVNSRVGLAVYAMKHGLVSL